MSKAVREAALKMRFQAVKVVKDIRRARRLLGKHPFDAKTFNAINGSNRSIETMLDRTIVFEALEDSEKLQLRKDINAALNANEDIALKALRDATTTYFQSVADAYSTTLVAMASSDNLKRLGFNKPAALEAFNGTQLHKGGLDIERTMSALEHIKLIAEEIEETIPDIDHDLEITSPEYEEEKHDNIDELPTEDNDDEDEIDDIELPEEDEDPVPNDNPEATESLVASVDWTCDHFKYIKAMASFLNNEPAALEAYGFTPEKAVDVLKAYNESAVAYHDAVEKFFALVDPDTCTSDSLLKGSVACYKRIDKIVSLIEKFEPVRKALAETCISMFEASDKMLVAQTTR